MNTFFECPICNLHTISFYSCDQCLKSICQTCHQNIIQSNIIQHSCPFCRKEFASTQTVETNETKIIDILYQVAIRYFMEDMDLDTAISSSVPNTLASNTPTQTPNSPNMSRFQESVQLGYLIGTGIYLFRQFFRTQ